MSDIKVLALVGHRTGAVHRELADPTRGGVRITITAGLADLPRYRDDVGPADTPSSVSALRAAAEEADAALVVSSSRSGTISAALKNAIDWLSHPPERNALYNKPLAVIAAAAGRYGGVWAHNQTDENEKSSSPSGVRVVESITVASLSDMVSKLAAEAIRRREA